MDMPTNVVKIKGRVTRIEVRNSSGLVGYRIDELPGEKECVMVTFRAAPDMLELGAEVDIEVTKIG